MSIAANSPVTSTNVNTNLMSKNVDNTAAGKQTFTNTTQSTDKDTGALVLEGGLGVEKNINAGGTILGSNLSGSNTGDITIAAVGAAPNANGMTLAGQVLNSELADATNPGVVGISSQSFAGVKTFVNGFKANAKMSFTQSVDSSTTGADQSVSPSEVYVKFTNASLSSINMISNPEDAKIFIFTNGTGGQLVFKNDAGGTAANRIITGSGGDLTLENDSSIFGIYDSNASRWKIIGGSGGGSSFADNIFEVKDDGDPTKKVVFQISGLTTGTTRTISMPNANTTMLGTDATQVVTNKDIDGGTASNTNRVTIPKDTLANLQALTRKEGTILYATDTDKFYSDNGTSLVAVGTGSGAKNYLPDGDSEATNPFTMYADGAAVPVDGTGGSPTATITQSSSSPLAGLKSFVFTSGGLGDGGAYAFTIDVADKLSIQTLEVSSDGVFAQDDLSVWLYDVTNSVLIAPQPTQYLSPRAGKQTLFFQLSNGTSFKFLIHQSSANSFTTKFEVSLSAMPFAGYSTIKTDWEAVTPTFAEFGTVSAISIYKAQDGKDLLLRGNFTVGSVGTGSPYMDMPNGLKIDSTKYPSGVVSVLGRVARGIGASGSGTYWTNLVYNGSDTAKIYFATGNGGDAPTTVTANASAQFTNSEPQLIADARIAILGWSSESKVVSEYDGRVVAAIYEAAIGTAITVSNPFQWNTKQVDTHNAVTTGASWKFTAPVQGIYRLSFTTYLAGANTDICLYKNNSLVQGVGYSGATSELVPNGTTLIQLNAGDYIDLRPTNSGATITDIATGSSAKQCISIELLSGSQQILAGQDITAIYEAASAVSVSPTQPADIATKVVDTTNSVTTGSAWKFTAPVKGKYLVSANLALTGVEAIVVYKNGAAYAAFSINGASTWMSTGTILVDLNVGDYIDFRAGGSSSLSSVSVAFSLQKISIKQVN